MRVLQTPSFKKAVKRLPQKDKSFLDEQIRKIIAAPEQGDLQRGDLAGVYTVKLTLYGAQFRLAYRFDKEQLELIAIGPRENFYKRLK